MTPDHLSDRLSPRGTARRKPGRTRRVVVAGVTAAACLGSAAILGSATVGYAALTYASTSIKREAVIPPRKHSPPKPVAGAQNILIVGSDSREGMTRKERALLHVGSEKSAEGKRSDVTMLLHIGTGAKKAELLSFPRDTWVEIPEHFDDGKPVPARHDKLNEAFHDGGGALTVRTVQAMTGIRIDHYIEVNFLGFVRMIEAVDGVEVCTPRALRDKDSGLDIKAGVSQLDASEALKYARARHLAGDDFGRIERQQKLIAAIVRKSSSSGVLTNPNSMRKLVNAALGAVTLDEGFGNEDFVALAQRMTSLKPSNLVFLDLPVADKNYNPPQKPKASAVLLDESGSRAIYEQIIRDDQVGVAATPSASPSPTVAPLVKRPGDVRVRVFNGSGVTGLGAKGAADLARGGFAVVGPARNAAATGAALTTIRADPGHAESLRTLRAALPDAVVEEVAGLGRTFDVVVGSTYTGTVPVKVSPLRAGSPPKPSNTPRTADDDACD